MEAVAVLLNSLPTSPRVETFPRQLFPPISEGHVFTFAIKIHHLQGDSGSKDGKGAASSQSSRKRAAEKALDGKTAGKKAMSNTQNGSSQELQSLTVEKLRAMLRDKGLSATGRKDELIARLRNGNA